MDLRRGHRVVVDGLPVRIAGYSRPSPVVIPADRRQRNCVVIHFVGKGALRYEQIATQQEGIGSVLDSKRAELDVALCSRAAG